MHHAALLTALVLATACTHAPAPAAPAMPPRQAALTVPGTDIPRECSHNGPSSPAAPTPVGSDGSVELVTCGIDLSPGSVLPYYEWRVYLVQHGAWSTTTRVPVDVGQGVDAGADIALVAVQDHLRYDRADSSNPPIVFLKYRGYGFPGEFSEHETILVWRLGPHPVQLAAFGGHQAKVVVADGDAQIVACQMTRQQMQERIDAISSGKTGQVVHECMEYPQRVDVSWARDGQLELSVMPLSSTGSGD